MEGFKQFVDQKTCEYGFFWGAYGLNPLLSATLGNRERSPSVALSAAIRALAPDFCGLCSRLFISASRNRGFLGESSRFPIYMCGGFEIQTSSVSECTNMACNYCQTTIAALHSSQMYDVIELLKAAFLLV